MMNKKVWPFLVPAVLVLILVVAKSWGTEHAEPANKYERILTTVADILEQAHYSPRKLDDNFSKEVFKAYMDDIDPDRTILLQSDIDKLKQYETEVDNELRNGKMGLVPAVDAVFNARLKEAAEVYKSILSKPFDFMVKETASLDGEDQPFAATEAERRENWRKRLKYMVLERYADALETREKNKDKKDFEVKADSTLEREARDRVLRIWNRTFDRLANKFTLDEKFNLYINTIAETMDPHTQFFPPIEKRAFDEAMSGEFFGIGAQLSEQDGNIKIVSLVTGSPAWKSGEIQVGDIILKVAQGAAEPVDITGFETTDAVKLIRGQKGTEVRLTMKKSDGSIKVVSMIRDKIVQEETFARSAIVKGEHKIGYVFLPEFYANFDDPNGARSARDVANEIKKLKAENVDGIIMDLRYNGGGSLQDVIQMVGLFIEDGPVVQVKDRDGEASVYRDKDKGVLYAGPLVVMINEFSASASEIFAAAIQDYKRGLIVGTPSFGKGTVQRNIGLDRTTGFFMPMSELGTLKLTLQKFYRINGGSTQLNGVEPDIILPDNYEFTKNREKDQRNPLGWDEIPKAAYNQWPAGVDIAQVQNQYQQQLQGNDAFKTIRANAEWLSQVNDKVVNLYLPEYQALQTRIRATVKQNDSLQTLTDPMNIAFIDADQERINKMDKDKGERFMNWLKGLKTDRYLFETSKILDQMIT
ncbi:MAG: carboxy terminal-processing peptidase, partial [Chitinophagaceae bacterium]|nr:carboxy terminal-processing peptidase [Chitinophagaceae bacterium]